MFGTFFNSQSAKTQANNTKILFGLTLLFGGIMRYFDAYLTNAIAPSGIVSFELAKDLETAIAMLNSWDETAKIAAGLSLGFDFIFPVVYSSGIALLLYRLNSLVWKDHAFYHIGYYLVNAMFIAMLCDFIENIGLIQLLLGNLSPFWVSVAYYFATIKFCLLFIGISAVLINFIIFLIKKRRK